MSPAGCSRGPGEARPASHSPRSPPATARRPSPPRSSARRARARSTPAASSGVATSSTATGKARPQPSPPEPVTCKPGSPNDDDRTRSSVRVRRGAARTRISPLRGQCNSAISRSVSALACGDACGAAAGATAPCVAPRRSRGAYYSAVGRKAICWAAIRRRCARCAW